MRCLQLALLRLERRLRCLQIGLRRLQLSLRVAELGLAVGELGLSGGELGLRGQQLLLALSQRAPRRVERGLSGVQRLLLGLKGRLRVVQRLLLGLQLGLLARDLRHVHLVHLKVLVHDIEQDQYDDQQQRAHQVRKAEPQVPGGTAAPPAVISPAQMYILLSSLS